jgi:hypothetical protein
MALEGKFVQKLQNGTRGRRGERTRCVGRRAGRGSDVPQDATLTEAQVRAYCAAHLLPDQRPQRTLLSRRGAEHKYRRPAADAALGGGGPLGLLPQMEQLLLLLRQPAAQTALCGKAEQYPQHNAQGDCQRQPVPFD